MRRATPNHVLFGGTVVGVTRLPSAFDRPFWIQPIDPSPGFKVQAGDWVDRGDVICSFRIQPGIFKQSVSADILSPISGRVIYTNDGLAFSVTQHGNFLDYLFMIEVPRGEVVPTDSLEVFDRFAQTLWDNRRRIFQKPRDSTFGAFTDEQVADALRTLRTAPLAVLPSSEYRERIEWLNLHKPHGIGHPKNLERSWD